MRIDPNVVVLPITDTKAGETKPRKAGESQSADVVSLSEHAAAASQREEVDLDGRAERVKALVAHGAYPIDLDQLASRIVDDDLLRSTK